MNTWYHWLHEMSELCCINSGDHVQPRAEELVLSGTPVFYHITTIHDIRWKCYLQYWNAPIGLYNNVQDRNPGRSVLGLGSHLAQTVCTTTWKLWEMQEYVAEGVDLFSALWTLIIKELRDVYELRWHSSALWIVILNFPFKKLLYISQMRIKRSIS